MSQSWNRRRDIIVETDNALFYCLESRDGCQEFRLRGEHEDGIFLNGIVFNAVVLEACGVVVLECTCSMRSTSPIMPMEGCTMYEPSLFVA